MEITYILVAPLLPIMHDYGASVKVVANQADIGACKVLGEITVILHAT